MSVNVVIRLDSANVRCYDWRWDHNTICAERQYFFLTLQGYLAFALPLKRSLVRHIPGVRVEIVDGPRSSFEVEVDGKLVFSKLRKGRLPENQRLVDEIIEYDHTKGLHRTHWVTLKTTGKKLGKTNVGGMV
jgi:selT/selW/selH-like putative selenoprotein